MYPLNNKFQLVLISFLSGIGTNVYDQRQVATSTVSPYSGCELRESILMDSDSGDINDLRNSLL